MTIDKVLKWIDNEDNKKATVCDAGCGVGSLAIPMATKFKKVFASDISKSMTNECGARAKDMKIKNIEFKVRMLGTSVHTAFIYLICAIFALFICYVYLFIPYTYPAI